MKKLWGKLLKVKTDQSEDSSLKEKFDPKTFCPLPFTHLEMNSDGRFRPCCKSNFQPEDYITASHQGDVWNTSVLKRIRKQLFNGEKAPECRNCFDLEEAGATSLRQKNLNGTEEHMKRFRDHAHFNPQTMHSYSHPTHVKLSLSNKCNLQCRMCNPLYSSRWEQALLKRDPLKKYVTESPFLQETEYGLSKSQVELEETMLDFLKKNAHAIERLDFLGGEPFLQSNHIRALELCVDSAENIRLEYSSNLTTLGNDFDKIKDLWKLYKSVEITVSLDGPPRVSDYIRHGSKSRIVEKNIKILKDWAENEGVQLHLLGGCAFSVYNTPFLIETVKYITALGLDFVINFVTSPEFQSPQVLPKAVKEKITEEFGIFKENPWKHLEKELNECKAWNQPDLRRMQVERVVEQLESLIVFMNAEDKSFLLGESRKFDETFNQQMDVGKRNPLEEKTDGL